MLYDVGMGWRSWDLCVFGDLFCLGGFLAFGFGFGFRLGLFGLVGNLGVLIYGWHFVGLVIWVDLI